MYDRIGAVPSKGGPCFIFDERRARRMTLWSCCAAFLLRLSAPAECRQLGCSGQTERVGTCRVCSHTVLLLGRACRWAKYVEGSTGVLVEGGVDVGWLFVVRGLVVMRGP